MNDKTKSYRDLTVWQRAIELAEEAYRITSGFPSEERYGMTSQIRRAAVSVPANIAEGQGRLGRGEFAHFLGIARGSLSELDTLFTLANRMGYMDSSTYEMMTIKIIAIRRPLHGLLITLRRPSS
jgi:four helix bundle protein